MGSVQLDIDISGNVLAVTLSDDKYVPDCRDAYLISWRKNAMQGRFGTVGEDGIMTAPRKSDYSTVFIAQLMHA